MATTNRDMNNMMRQRRRDMADMPMDMSKDTSVDPDVAEEPNESTFTVAAPGDASTGDQFEYEPMTDIAGAWVVYPPGVPCDDTAYRIQMDKPAEAEDFAEMQQALDDAEGGSTSASTASRTPPPASTEEAM